MALINKRILVTGADGFIGRNLCVRLGELEGVDVVKLVRADSLDKLSFHLRTVDAVVHLAGENRPINESDFAKVNTGLTQHICEAIEQEFIRARRYVPLVFASSTQADRDNPYGRSKLAAEQAVKNMADATGNPCSVFRFPGVFGKWGRPNYNSVVATFCHNLARDLPIQISDPTATLRLVYVDDLISSVLSVLENPPDGFEFATVRPEYSITLGALAEQIRSFVNCRHSLMSERVGTGLTRALYATFVSYLPDSRFSYTVPQHSDPRGVFVEMLKTPDSGQFSYFTAHPGVTRGGHYHHTKTEKFLVIKGEALFRFRHLITQELVEIKTSGSKPEVVDTIPGWTHDITNIGQDDMLVMLWANENFDRQRPDTIASKI